MDFEKVTDETYKENGLTRKIDGAVDYDLIDNTSPENKIIGKMPKKFVRLDSKYFKSFFDERKNGEVSYSTYFTDEDNRMNYEPSYVSSLIKVAGLVIRDCVFETYVSRVLNHFKVSTVYNNVCMDEDGRSYIASIDFIKPNERLVLFSEIGQYVGDFGDEIDLKKSVDCIKDKVIELYSLENFELSDEQLKTHIEDFIKSYLVRICLLKDYDFTIRNCGLLVNDKEKSIRFAPNFDFEYCFRLRDYKFLQEDIFFVIDEYPHLFEDFVSKLDRFVTKKDDVELYKLLYANINGVERYEDTVFKTIKEQSENIFNEYHNIKG